MNSAYTVRAKQKVIIHHLSVVAAVMISIARWRIKRAQDKLIESLKARIEKVKGESA